ncbi:DUF2637 domain-containing protein [Streptomyces neyagawaensis]|uniref:DUF2637 domain-containing protein n=1 Tax=Streptomyces neyagawaensis TaxID=42238 RepID=UPI0006E3DCEE|nr:DUF2637 domain-containing protein [Streptomyces neyagawaensis]MCL6734401.1 DUF2637 domain-containing protein [Streptomyces neyagawaensis]MDE1682030.1 DUF2637 domain-containing protein [Streptomyces neyagawaensis]
MAELHPSAPAHPSNTQPRAITALAITAAALIFLLTGVSLWLSYEHLHDVGARHGFADDPIRAWAWPATLDLFYAAGEVLILRAALARRIDWWAISLVVFGAGGSIALNIAGVGEGAEPLDYVVAAVPPVASLLAFGALMNQLYRLLAKPAATAPAAPPVPEETGDEEEHVPAPVMPPAPPVIPPVGPGPMPGPTPIKYSDARCSVIRALYNAGTRPGTKAMRIAISDAGLGDASDGFIRGTLRAEVEQHEPHLAQLPPAPVPLTA